MQTTNVLLFFGGESSEHDVSLASAKNVFEAIDKKKYNVTLCFIDRSGKWWHVQSVEDAASGKKHPRLAPVIGDAMLIAWPSGTIIRPDVILPVLHGSNGEDGSIQGLAQLLHIPIAGPSILGASISMDKEVSKRLLAHSGVPVVDWVCYRKSSGKAPTYAHTKKYLGSTVFIKPSSQGSSVGVSKARNEKEFDEAIKTALTYDHKVLIERAIDGRELEVAVIGNEDPKATKVGEIASNNDFYSYEAKYDESSPAQVMVPASLSAKQHEELSAMALKVYKVLECRGLARVDFFLTPTGKVYVNEINTLPGFTNISMYPKLWSEEGVEYSDLIDKLIQYALEK